METNSCLEMLSKTCRSPAALGLGSSSYSPAQSTPKSKQKELFASAKDWKCGSCPNSPLPLSLSRHGRGATVASSAILWHKRCQTPLHIGIKQVSSPGSRVIVNSFSCAIHHCGIPDVPLASPVTDISVPSSVFRQVNRQDESTQVIGGSPYQRISILLAPRLAQELPAFNILGQQLFKEGLCPLRVHCAR